MFLQLAFGLGGLDYSVFVSDVNAGAWEQQGLRATYLPSHGFEVFASYRLCEDVGQIVFGWNFFIHFMFSKLSHFFFASLEYHPGIKWFA